MLNRDHARSPLGRARITALLTGIAILGPLAIPGPARADDDKAKAKSAAKDKDSDRDEQRALHQPVRLTAGGSNQWMGVRDPAADAVYFVSDDNATAEIYVQQPVHSGPRLLHASNADVSWP
ncbi:MAG: hypothetical protein AAGC55_34125, partial [Myxococcota bacterium]